jgi:hypothetical protein
MTWTRLGSLKMNTITKYGTFEPRIQLRTSCLPFLAFSNRGLTTMTAIVFDDARDDPTVLPVVNAVAQDSFIEALR